MELFAAEKLAVRKLIEYKGQDFFRNNNLETKTISEKAGDALRVSIYMYDKNENQKKNENKNEDHLPLSEQSHVTITVNLKNGEALVVEDNI